MSDVIYIGLMIPVICKGAAVLLSALSSDDL